MSSDTGRGVRSSRRRWHVGLVVLVVAGCGEPDRTGTPPTPVPADTAVDSTTIVMTTTADSATTAVAASPTEPPPVDGPCPEGALPAIGAMDLPSGEALWRMCSPDEVFRQTIGATADIVVVLEEPRDSPGSIVAVSTADGAELWRHPSPRYAATPRGPAGSDGVVALTTGDGDLEDAELIGVDATTGEERWRVAEPLTVLGYGDGVVIVATLAAPSGESTVRGLDPATGAALWQSPVSRFDASGVMTGRTPNAVSGATLAIPTGETTTGIDVGTGAELWTARQVDGLTAANGAIVGQAPITGPEASVVALDPALGDELWSAPGRLSYGGIVAAGSGVVAVLGDGEIVAYDVHSGAERWRAEAWLQPQLVDGGFVVSLWEADIDARSVDGGTVAWAASVPFGTPWMNDAISNGDTVFVAMNSLPWGD